MIGGDLAQHALAPGGGSDRAAHARRAVGTLLIMIMIIMTIFSLLLLLLLLPLPLLLLLLFILLLLLIIIILLLLLQPLLTTTKTSPECRQSLYNYLFNHYYHSLLLLFHSLLHSRSMRSRLDGPEVARWRWFCCYIYIYIYIYI